MKINSRVEKTLITFLRKKLVLCPLHTATKIQQ